MFGTTNYESKSGVTGLTLARITLGVIMAAHGFQKLTGFEQWHGHVVSMGLPFPDVAAWLAVAGELLGGLGLIVGLFTPVAAFGVVCTMLVAIAKVHWSHGLFAQDNGFEYPLLILASSLFFMLRGAGPFSLDAWRAQITIRHERSMYDRPSTHVPMYR
jgi:putative oxidoreductase